ncbi:MAG: DNA translocase FtsK [Candidatus Zixiibacteriota bacterium]|nr:MAG: DNA translocase FtsK [candidate division Zixibacteria bacterium]
MASASRKKGGAAASRKSRGHGREIAGILLLAAALLSALALATYPDGNLLRGFGDLLASALILPLLGRWPAFVFPFLLLLWAGAILLRWRRPLVTLISLEALLAAFWLSFVLYLAHAPWPDAEQSGAVGMGFGDAVYNFMGPVGGWTVWSAVVACAAVLHLRFRPSSVLQAILGLGALAGKYLWKGIASLRLPQIRKDRPAPAPVSRGEDEALDDLLEPAGDDLDDFDAEAPEEPLIKPGGKRTTLPLFPPRPASESHRSGAYQLPPLTLLADPPPESPDAPEELKAKAKRLQSALADFGVGARVVKVNPGPVITRFDLEPDPGVKVSRISALADDLALVLRARAIRIQAPIPGQGAVGVEIPNRHPSTVVLKAVVNHGSFQGHPSTLAIALGETAAGDPYVSDLGKMPHLLVAGTTGSGKSVCLNAIIASLLLRNPPEKLQFVIIDPKKLEMSIYARLARHHLMVSPQLDEEVITTPGNAVLALGGVEIEMARRYDLLAEAGVRNIEEFNKLAANGGAAGPDPQPVKPLSYLIVVIDELADLMMVSAKEIEEPIARLAQMARAVGIHLIVATQRPSVDVITGVIKANFPARLAFQVASKVDSRTILDVNGADTLLGNGDALFIPPGRGQPERIHSCFVSPEEIEGIVIHIENQPDEFYRYPLVIPQPGSAGGGEGEEMGEVDNLFEDAVRIVIHQGQASVSILQRRLKIGYARAGRLIDQLERAGVVGPFDGSKAREVLVDTTYLDHLGGGPPPPL